jgi:hypothetical protein
MKALSKFTGDNMGGIATLWAVPPTDILSIQKSNGNIYDVYFATTANIYAIYFTAETASFAEQKKQTEAGIIYEQTFSGIIPKDTPSMQEHVDYIERRKWLVIYLDQNGYYKLIGQIDSPLSFAGNLELPPETKGLNKMAFTFEGKTTRRAYFINDPFASL